MKSDELLNVLFDSAKAAFLNAYSPYSGHKVGAALLTDSGQVYAGCNVENASYGGTVCAERVAIMKAVSEGHRRFKGILVITDQEDPWAPCGLCRQVMAEFFESDAPVIMANLKKKVVESTVKDLCPGLLKPEQVLSNRQN